MSKRCERLLEHVATPWCHFNDVIWNWARTQVSGRHRFSRLDEFRILIESLYFWKRFRFAKYTSSLFTSIPTKDIKLIVDILSSFLFVDLFRFFVVFGFICLGLVCLGFFFVVLFWILPECFLLGGGGYYSSGYTKYSKRAALKIIRSNYKTHSHRPYQLQTSMFTLMHERMTQPQARAFTNTHARTHIWSDVYINVGMAFWSCGCTVKQ